MSSLRLTIWVTPRVLWLLAAIALALACAPGFPPLLAVAAAIGTALIVACACDAWLGPRDAELSIRRSAPEHLALNVSTQLQYEIENRSTQPIRIGLFETPARTLRYDVDEVEGDVVPHGRAVLVRTIVPVERGKDELGDIYFWYENRFGLLRRRRRIVAAQAIAVYPDLSAVAPYHHLRVRNRTIEAGARRIALRGAGTEFESLRDWNDGDAFGAIDWKATARHGKLVVAQYEVERSQSVMLLLDCGRLMTARIDGNRKLDYAVTAALSLASIAALASDRVGLIAFARDIITARAPRSTRSSIAQLTQVLYDVEPRFEESGYPRAFAFLRRHLRKRSMIVLLTDVIDPLAQAAILGEIAPLAAHHLLLFVFMNDDAVGSALAREPETVAGAYRALVARGLAEERRLAKAKLERTGAIVIDVPARRLTTALIDEYLRIKRRALL